MRAFILASLLPSIIFSFALILENADAIVQGPTLYWSFLNVQRGELILMFHEEIMYSPSVSLSPQDLLALQSGPTFRASNEFFRFTELPQFRLTQQQVEFDPSIEGFFLILTFSERDTLRLQTQNSIGKQSSSSYLTFNEGVIYSRANSTSSLRISPSSAIQFSDLRFQTRLSSVEINLARPAFIFNFSREMAETSDLSMISILGVSSNSGQNQILNFGSSGLLMNASYVKISGSRLSLVLSKEPASYLQAFCANSLPSCSALSLSGTSLKDADGYPVENIDSLAPLSISSLIKDTEAPSLEEFSFAISHSVGRITLTFDEYVNISSVNISSIQLFDNQVTPTETVRLSSFDLVVAKELRIIQISLGYTTIARILSNSLLCKSRDSCILNFDSSFICDAGSTRAQFSNCFPKSNNWTSLLPDSFNEDLNLPYITRGEVNFRTLVLTLFFSEPVFFYEGSSSNISSTAQQFPLTSFAPRSFAVEIAFPYTGAFSLNDNIQFQAQSKNSSSSVLFVDTQGAIVIPASQPSNNFTSITYQFSSVEQISSLLLASGSSSLASLSRLNEPFAFGFIKSASSTTNTTPKTENHTYYFKDLASNVVRQEELFGFPFPMNCTSSPTQTTMDYVSLDPENFRITLHFSSLVFLSSIQLPNKEAPLEVVHYASSGSNSSVPMEETARVPLYFFGTHRNVEIGTAPSDAQGRDGGYPGLSNTMILGSELLAADIALNLEPSAFFLLLEHVEQFYESAQQNNAPSNSSESDLKELDALNFPVSALNFKLAIPSISLFQDQLRCQIRSRAQNDGKKLIYMPIGLEETTPKIIQIKWSRQDAKALPTLTFWFSEGVLRQTFDLSKISVASSLSENASISLSAQSLLEGTQSNLVHHLSSNKSVICVQVDLNVTNSILKSIPDFGIYSTGASLVFTPGFAGTYFGGQVSVPTTASDYRFISDVSFFIDRFEAHLDEEHLLLRFSLPINPSSTNLRSVGLKITFPMPSGAQQSNQRRALSSYQEKAFYLTGGTVLVVEGTNGMTAKIILTSEDLTVLNGDASLKLATNVSLFVYSNAFQTSFSGKSLAPVGYDNPLPASSMSLHNTNFKSNSGASSSDHTMSFVIFGLVGASVFICILAGGAYVFSRNKGNKLAKVSVDDVTFSSKSVGTEAIPLKYERRTSKSALQVAPVFITVGSNPSPPSSSSSWRRDIVEKIKEEIRIGDLEATMPSPYNSTTKANAGNKVVPTHFSADRPPVTVQNAWKEETQSSLTANDTPFYQQAISYDDENEQPIGLTQIKVEMAPPVASTPSPPKPLQSSLISRSPSDRTRKSVRICDDVSPTTFSTSQYGLTIQPYQGRTQAYLNFESEEMLHILHSSDLAADYVKATRLSTGETGLVHKSHFVHLSSSK